MIVSCREIVYDSTLPEKKPRFPDKFVRYASERAMSQCEVRVENRSMRKREFE